MGKLFTFSAESFPLDSHLESFLRSKDAVFMDFGSAAYLRSDAMPAILLELMTKSVAERSVPAPQDTTREITNLSAELEKDIPERNRLIAKIESLEGQLKTLRNQVANALRAVETLESENKRLVALKSTPAAESQTQKANETLRPSYEVLQKDFQSLRSQNIEALASLKILEEENEELRLELEKLRNAGKQSAANEVAGA